MSTDITIYQSSTIMSVDQAIPACLDEKHGRSGSAKTQHAYRTTLQSFRGMLTSAGLDLESEPALIAPLAQGWAGHSAREGQTVTPSTFNQRLAIVSSFYEYAIRNDVLPYNPMERVKRRIVRAVAKSLFAACGGRQGGRSEDTSRSAKGRLPLGYLSPRQDSLPGRLMFPILQQPWAHRA